MIKDLQNIISYLHTTAIDPFPRYILKKEILCQTPTADDAAAIHASKRYKQLADEQWDDGSWGRFHSMDSRIKDNRKFVTTEAALRRAHELGLTKDNRIVAKCIKLMERYVRNEETWRDNIEKHHDNGKSHLHSRPYLTAAWLKTDDVKLPAARPITGHYAESWRDKNARKNDMIIRIFRLLVKC